ncbi:MAG: tetratricopeptide repeat protein [Gemmatimonadales bacterium]
MSDGAGPSPLDALRGELAAIEQSLDATTEPAEREAVKQRIVALFKKNDALLTELGEIKERIRGLVERYKREAPGASAPEPDAGPRGRVRADHLGASTYVDKGWSLIALGDHAGAAQALTRALELAPDDVQAKSLLGWAEMLGANYDRALAIFSEVLAAEPTNALARVNVGFICLRKRIFGEAIEHLSRVIRLDNDRKATLYAHYYLGLVYLEREMYLDARTFLEKAIVLGPNLIEAYYDLGRAEWYAGEREAARRTWTKGAGANKFAPWAKRCQELLDKVERGESVPRSPSPV